MRDAWALDDSIHFLNHGSFGATPKVVLAKQAELRARLESEPVRFMARELEPLLDATRARVAEFLGADPADLVFVTNATTGVNAIVRSLAFDVGDELVTTSHGYNACTNVLRFAAEQTGARVVIAPVPFPVSSSKEIADATRSVVTERTKLVLLDQISSPTAVVFPVDELVAEFEGRGIQVLVDAAHAPGHVPLNLGRTNASFTTGNLHKWVCAPKGVAFLHVRRELQDRIRPTVISHGANSKRTDRSRFQLEFDWMGTSDPTAILSVPTALDFMGSLLPGGWPALMKANHDGVVAARARLLDVLQTPAPCPTELLGAMASVIVPWPEAGLEKKLFETFHIEVPVIPRGPQQTLVRVSMQRHVREQDVEALAAAFRSMKSGGAV
ncbi:MAG: aminotransferase class V-fold PLP-dependent enzyme [Archangium sp.]|nr:aminotransferase class V-fold PLP-dependent enzyme [Archangium sp.]